MLVLAIETTGLSGSVALADDSNLLAERTLTEGQRSAQSLIPSIDQLLRGAGRQVADIGLIGVAIGPGSFTGLRVGVTAAKTLAYAIGAQTVGVDTLDVLAARAPAGSPEGRLHTILDAQRQELFAASFIWRDDVWRRTTATEIIPTTVWLASLAAGDLVSGPAASRLSERMPGIATVISDELSQPRASTLARQAFADYQRGRVDDFWKLAPAYYRPSAAEEKAKR